MAKQYELLLIVDASASEEARGALIEKTQKMIQKLNGIVDNVQLIGLKRYAYQINDKSEGFYVLINFTAEPSVPMEVERQLRITDNYVRSLFISK